MKLINPSDQNPEYLAWLDAGNTPLPVDELTTNQGA